MKKPTFCYFLLAALAIFQACKHKTNTTPNLESDGIPGEIMVVAKEDQIAEIESLFAKYFQIKNENLIVSEKSGSGQFENKFNYFFVRHKAYEGTEKTAPNIIIWGNAGQFSEDLDALKPSKTIQTGPFEIHYYKNIWAKNQLIAWVKKDASNAEESTIKAIAAACTNYFYLNETLPGNMLPSKYIDSINRLISDNYGFKLAIPSQFKLEMTNTEIIWLRQETTRFYRDIFINIFSDSLPIDSKENAIENRNLFCKKYLKNDEGTLVLVSTSPTFLSYFKKTTDLGNANTSTLRGWYQEEGTYRRGPFIRTFFHDKPHKRYIALDQFVYAPDMPRSMFYHTAEIIARSLTFNK